MLTDKLAGPSGAISRKNNHLSSVYPISLLLTSALVAAAATARADLFVSSFNQNSVRRYDENTGAFLDTFISSGSGGLSAPHRGIFGVDGNFYVASANNDRVLRYDGQSGAFMDVFIQNGTNGLPAGALDYPVDMTIGPDGALYVSSQLNDSVLRFNATTGAFIDTFVAGASGGLDGPSGIQFHNGDFFVAGRFSDAVYRFDGSTGAFEMIMGTSGLRTAFGLDIGPDGILYVVNGGGSRVEKFDPGTGASLGGFSIFGLGGPAAPIGLEFGPDSNLYVATFGMDSVQEYHGVTGVFVGDFVTEGSGGLQQPNFITFAVPEPSVATLLAGALVVLARRHRSFGAEIR